MSAISNERVFRAQLEKLDAVRQREVGAKFVNHVLDLSKDERIQRVLAVAANTKAGKDELNVAAATSRQASVEGSTRCGAEGDWSDQASYFVARAAAALLAAKPSALQAAMNSRMARTSASIHDEVDGGHDETAVQYRLLTEYLNAG
jgi:hypothetical protein